MVRWEPDTKQRLIDAAYTLFSEKGFDEVTGKQIAARAGLTERTFFRYFADKRDVLFTDIDALDARLTSRIEEGDEDAPTLTLVFGAFSALADHIGATADHARLREAVVSSSPELRERERTKYAHIETTIAHALTRRGVPEFSAKLASGVGCTGFLNAWNRWLTSTDSRTLDACLEEVRAEFDALQSQRP